MMTAPRIREGGDRKQTAAVRASLPVHGSNEKGDETCRTT